MFTYEQQQRDEQLTQDQDDEEAQVLRRESRVNATFMSGGMEGFLFHVTCKTLFMVNIT